MIEIELLWTDYELEETQIMLDIADMIIDEMVIGTFASLINRSKH